MAAWTLAEAQAHLASWMAADTAVASGQSYTIGSRSLTRADAAEILNMLKFWRIEVERLEAARVGGPRLVRVVPRDI